MCCVFDCTTILVARRLCIRMIPRNGHGQATMCCVMQHTYHMSVCRSDSSGVEIRSANALSARRRHVPLPGSCSAAGRPTRTEALSRQALRRAWGAGGRRAARPAARPTRRARRPWREAGGATGRAGAAGNYTGFVQSPCSCFCGTRAACGSACSTTDGRVCQKVGVGSESPA